MADKNMDFSRISEDEKINGIKITKVPKYIREKAYLTDFSETLAQLAEMIIQLGVNLSLDPDEALEWARKLQQSISQSEFDSWVATLLDGGPSIFMNTLSELQSTYPNGAPGVALVRETDPAKIYVWNGTAWEDFGDYQGIEIKDGTVTAAKLADGEIGVDKFDSGLKSLFSGGIFENLMKNPLMTSSESWSTALATIISTTNGVMTFQATEPYGNARQTIVENAIPNHTYYLSVEVKASSIPVAVMLVEGASSQSPQTRVDVTQSDVGGFVRLSLTHTTSTTNPLQVRIADLRQADRDQVQFRKPVFVDLTKHFGTGNEPTISAFEKTLADINSGEVFFYPSTSEVYVDAKRIIGLESPETGNLYVRVAEDIDIISMYGKDNMYFNLGKRGVNQIFDFKNMYKINSNGSLTTDFDTTNRFYNNSTDWFSPYIIEAKANADGDNIGSRYYTGGNHGYDNGGTIEGNSATGRTSELKYYVDGELVANFEGYANEVKIIWKNRIQANNTTKADGSGREVLEETHEMTFDGKTWKVTNDIMPLEDLTIEKLYGLQMQFWAWSGTFRFLGGGERRLLNTETAHTSGSQATVGFKITSSIGDVAEFAIDPTFDLGKRELLDDPSGAITSATKLYTWLVGGTRSAKDLLKDNYYSFRGYYKFYKE